MTAIDSHSSKLDSPARLTLALLGPVQIVLDSQPLSFAYEKAQMLLIYLALEPGHAHRRMQLAELLWPEQDEASARHNLSQAIFTLRRAIHDTPQQPLLIATREALQLHPGYPIWVDVLAFRRLLAGAAQQLEQLEQAATLYCGEFLEGFGVGDSAELEEWVLLMREQLRAQASGLLQRLSDPTIGLLDPGRICDYARHWVALDPLDEAAHRRLMQALAHNGQRAAALTQYEHCRRLLDAELGLEPEPETIALYEELKQRTAPAAHSSPRPIQLPQPGTRLIGREQELAALTELVCKPGSRLITISGPGGVGKTRLALAAATQSAAYFPDGVIWLALAPIREPAQLLMALAQVLHVSHNDRRPLETLIHEALAQRQALLLLDNAEHLLPALALLVNELLAAAPYLVILVTSRMVLRLSQEQRYLLMPLRLPDEKQPDQEIQASAAVALFIERSQAVRPGVELDLTAIREICQRLDGLPLAIELAATRTRLLSPTKLLARLQRRLPLLSGGLADMPQRHQTLQATIDWSYQLLDSSQQLLLQRLAIFADGWTLAAAEAVCADVQATDLAMTSVLDGLTALLDASLINAAPNAAGELRFSMLETIREFALEQITTQAHLEDSQQRHANYFVALAAQAAPALSGPEQGIWLRHFDDELDNIRAVLIWCLEHDIGAGLCLASDLHRFWLVRGYRREGRDWLYSLLKHDILTHGPAASAQQRAYALLIAGMLSMFMSDFKAATDELQESLEIYLHLEEPYYIAWALNNLGNVALQQNDYTQAEQYYQESLTLRQQIKHVLGMASTCNNLGEVKRQQGDLSAARVYFEQSLAWYQEDGDVSSAASVMGHIATVLLKQGQLEEAQQLYEASYIIAQELGNKAGMRQTQNGLGNVAYMRGRYAQARQHYQNSLILAVEIDHLGAISLAMLGLARLASAEQNFEQAIMLLGVAAALDKSAHLSHDPDDKSSFEELLGTLQAQLDSSHFEVAWQRGQALPIKQAIAMACL